MRIVAGEFSSRRIEAPKGRTTRPTLDKVREAVFSSLGGYLAVDTEQVVIAEQEGVAISKANFPDDVFRAYVIENGKISMEGTGRELLEDEKVREAYLGSK